MVLDKGLNMHNTLSTNFKGFVENFYVLEGNLKITGWLYSITHDLQDVTFHLDMGQGLPIVFYSNNERQDVANWYKDPENKRLLYSGFDMTIPFRNSENYQIFAMVRGQKEVIFNLSTVKEVKQVVETTHVNETSNIKIRNKIVPDVIVVDNFYEDPDLVRDLALSQNFEPDLRYHKGRRTAQRFLPDGLKQTFEALIGARITNWANYDYNGVFQYCTAEDALVYHCDVQRYAGAIYLSPDAPVTTGTSFFRSRKYPQINTITTKNSSYNEVFEGGFYDKTKFELVDTVGNLYNRLVLWNGHYIHSASEYFGSKKEDSRLFHLFFFDIEE